MTVTEPKYDVPALLELSGAPPRGNRHDCPKCGGFRTVTHTAEYFYCHRCRWKGNALTLAKELGVYRRLSSAEWRELRERREQADAEARIKAEQSAAQARRLAEAIWQRATPVGEDHPYLVRKRVKPHGLRQSCGNLVVPVRDGGGTLHSLQLVSPRGDKEFLFGGRVSGCCCGIGSLKRCIWLCEGFATGATVFEATGEAVAVCFFAGNLGHVAAALRGRFPAVELIICADNDHQKPDNPGRTAAIDAARKFGLRAIWPTFPDGKAGSDFNDLALEVGIEAVGEELQSVFSLALDEGQ